MIFNPAELAPEAAYKLITGAVLPRPIAFVSTRGQDGVDNLAPFSFFTVVCANPLTICFSPMRRGPLAEEKDTLVNLRASGEFVVNVVDEALLERMNLCAAELPPEDSEFDLSGLTPAACELVAPPRVLESPISLECKLLQIVDVSDRPYGGSLVMGTVVRIHLRDALHDQGKIKPWQPVGRLAGASYVRMTDTFALERPSVAEARATREAPEKGAPQR